MKNKSSTNNKSNTKTRSIKDYFFINKNSYSLNGDKSELKSNTSKSISNPVIPVSKPEVFINYLDDDDDDDDAFSQQNNIILKKFKFDRLDSKRQKTPKRAKTEEERFEVDLAIKVSKATSQHELRSKSNICQLLTPLEGRQLANSKLLDWLQTVPDFVPSQNKNGKKYIGELWSELSFEKSKRNI